MFVKGLKIGGIDPGGFIKGLKIGGIIPDGYPWTKYRWIDPVFINRLKIVVGLILFVNKD